MCHHPLAPILPPLRREPIQSHAVQHWRAPHRAGTLFLFLLAAGVRVRLPTMLAVLVGIATMYWSWCLAMYRDTGEGLGIFASLTQITLEGFRVPWLITLERMGSFPSGTSTLPLLGLVGATLWVLWTTDPPVHDGRSDVAGVESRETT